MRQKTKNHRKQGSFDKKFDFFPQTLSHIPGWVRFVQKTQAKNSHAWAPLNALLRIQILVHIREIMVERPKDIENDETKKAVLPTTIARNSLSGPTGV
jgi:hypothetical protein